MKGKGHIDVRYGSIGIAHSGLYMLFRISAWVDLDL